MTVYANTIIATVVAAYGSFAVAQHQHAPVPVVQAPAPTIMPTPSVMTAPTGVPPGTVARQSPASSAIVGYRRFDAAEPMSDWRQANKIVEVIGGWRAYAKEAANANSALAPAGGAK